MRKKKEENNREWGKKNEKGKKACRHGQSWEICGGLKKSRIVIGQNRLTCRKMERLISSDLMARFMCSELMRTLKFSAVCIMTLFICKSSAVCFLTIPPSLSLCFHMWNAVDEVIICAWRLNLHWFWKPELHYNITFKMKLLFFLTKVLDKVKLFLHWCQVYSFVQ